MYFKYHGEAFFQVPKILILILRNPTPIRIGKRIELVPLAFLHLPEIRARLNVIINEMAPLLEKIILLTKEKGQDRPRSEILPPPHETRIGGKDHAVEVDRGIDMKDEKDHDLLLMIN